jgi:drug/metabolite transporter (DMT)-like permease
LNFGAVKFGVTHGIAPIAYASLRYGAAGIALCGFALMREGSLRIRGEDLRLLAAAAFLGVFVNQLALVYSLRLAPASLVALLFGTGPLIVAALSHVSGIERVSPKVWLSGVVCFAGVALVVLGTGRTISSNLLGMALALVIAGTWAAYAVAVAPLIRRHSPLRINALATLVGSIPLLLCAMPQLSDEAWGKVTAYAWLCLAYSLVCAYLLANAVWLTAIQTIGPARAALYSNLQPFLAAVFAVLVLSERLTAVQILGGSVIACGIIASRRKAPVVIAGE